jgi:tetratricopeptide (TPR) repeat protein
MEEDEETKDGISNLEKGDYDKAILSFEEGLKIGNQKENNRYLFYLGYTYSIKGEKNKALKYLNKSRFDPSDEIFEEYTLLKGKILVENLSFQRALKLFDLYIQHYPEGEYFQEVNLLSAICLKGVGKSKEAINRLKLIEDKDPTTVTGKLAKEKLNEM